MRLAKPDELDLVRAITDAAYAQYPSTIGIVPMPVIEDYAPRIAAGQVWLLDVDGVPAALSVIETHDDHLMIYSLAVRPTFQGRGLGRSLLDHSMNLARAAGVSEVRLYTNALMTRNIALYTGYGFHETGRRPHPLRSGWTIVDMACQVA